MENRASFCVGSVCVAFLQALLSTQTETGISVQTFIDKCLRIVCKIFCNMCQQHEALELCQAGTHNNANDTKDMELDWPYCQKEYRYYNKNNT